MERNHEFLRVDGSIKTAVRNTGGHLVQMQRGLVCGSDQQPYVDGLIQRHSTVALQVIRLGA